MVRSKGSNLTLRQLGTLLTCHTTPGPHTVRGLSEAVGTHKPAISRAVDVLENHKLVRRSSDPTDRRSVLIDTTKAGNALCRGFETSKRVSTSGPPPRNVLD
ncbi:MarR family winged helix-turn-helix transcriptional regulator [Acidisoma sp. L85]|uniref:MarR family winged helix-turn-helix transcriptional regulator n=1 Tax=Acidisoma sp. L85 TaxID=1641850 RepID=UPI00352A1C1A